MVTLHPETKEETMKKAFNLDKKDVQRIAAAAVGALILSTTMVASAIGPARAVETAEISASDQGRA